jgi:hypothetical protein
MRRRRDPNTSSTGSISVGGAVEGSALSTGHENKQEVINSKGPTPEVLEALREISATLEVLSGPNTKIAKAQAATAIRAATAKKLDKKKVGSALDGALKAAKKSAEFAGVAAKLAPYVKTAAAWIGGEWSQLVDLLS